MIAVDELRTYLGRGRISGEWCHLTTDGTREELHNFALSIGAKRHWFQDHPTLWHYDLRPSKRAMALKRGAVEVIAREWLPKLMEARKGTQ